MLTCSARREPVALLTSAGNIRRTSSLPTLARRWTSSAAPRRPRTAVFFPGQGVQRVGMTKPWVDAFPRTAKPILDEIDDTLGFSLTRLIEEGSNKQLNATENSQPAIMATSILVLRVLQNEFGFDLANRVDFTLGHSLGEFAALVAAGYLEFKDSLLMVRRRGEVMAKISRATCDEHGGEVGMVALVCEKDEHLQPLIDAINEFTALSSQGSKYDSEDVPPVQQVVIANINSKNQIVLSGSIERIQTLLTHLRQFGGHDPRHVRLHADSPFHSPLMKPAEHFMSHYLDTQTSVVTGGEILKWPGTIPCVSNVSARPFGSLAELKNLLARSCVDTVRWSESVHYLQDQALVRRYVGIGPGKVGRNLVGKEVGMKGRVKGGGVWGITSPAEAEECMRGLAETEHYDDESGARSLRPQASPDHANSRTVPRAVEDAAKRTASYVLNPAIVQQLWPPPQRIPAFNLSAPGV